ncbi:MurR/RpiR family transcriptional regulator [Desulfopila aestuarii]|uniref:Transcriptional regulator, RpiR family n=1 Tax=Desulfopila aestuarii DSM 18488 TaxID=1121416 RepID=A0A1M7YEU6_9BACT|nr:MurR/RpiR family transcriptional regulator [Desulfopila aestuarii]SHO51150.1 transcriptional regulator, RpiR family [Desulfopila aestuarii DSM 18488]
MTTDTIALIRNSLDSLRKSEKKVATCVLGDPKAVVTSSITELAEKSGTSEPTVIRFCRKLGLGGYMELRLNLARDLPSSKYIFENISTEDSLAGIAGKVINAHSEAISNTLNKLNLDDLEKAVQLLHSARRVEFYGFGGSAIVAKDAYHKFFRLGIPCAAQDDSHMQVMSAALLTPEDVIVAISHTGSSKDLIDSARIAAKSGAKVIGIVGNENAPLIKYCDIALSAHSQEAAILLAPMTSRLVQLAILDVLFVAVAMKNFHGTKDRLDRVKRSLVDKRH